VGVTSLALLAAVDHGSWRSRRRRQLLLVYLLVYCQWSLLCYLLQRHNMATCIRSLTVIFGQLGTVKCMSIYTVIQKTPTFFIWLWFLQMLTDFYNIWHSIQS